MLPGIEKGRTTDYGALTDDRLLETLEEMRGEFLHRYVVHGRINFVVIAASQFADFYLETFQPEDPTEPYEALQGFPTRSVDAGRGLWRLGRTVKASPDLARAFAETETSDLVTGLEGSDEGRKFLDDLRIYLDEFGWRSDAFELSDPTWREDPTIPLNTLQGYMYLDDDADPEVRFQEAVERRHELLDRARQRLAAEPEKLAQFDQLYEMARHYLPITENHNYYIDQVGNGIMRLPFMELGRRLVNRGTLADAGDVFFLYLDEARAGLTGTDGRARVAEREADLERWSRVVPVPAIGEPPEPHGDPLEAGIQKMFGAPPEPSRDPGVINGIGTSQGTVQGTAKVVRSLSEASKLRQGDVMVCEMTMPPWTPLFSTVSAVVADTGGVLSHCAIVSREYRMPCVVGTIVGTAVIKDGMQLTVDGSQGIVRIESRT
jgi:pyruvate,water dikinase